MPLSCKFCSTLRDITASSILVVSVSKYMATWQIAMKVVVTEKTSVSVLQQRNACVTASAQGSLELSEQHRIARRV
jgi:hypothetical protein